MSDPLTPGLRRRLAKVGYYAIVPDLYTRTADLTKISNMAEIVPIVNAKRDTERGNTRGERQRGAARHTSSVRV